jgi:hypothetical protein
VECSLGRRITPHGENATLGTRKAVHVTLVTPGASLTRPRDKEGQHVGSATGGLQSDVMAKVVAYCDGEARGDNQD